MSSRVTAAAVYKTGQEFQPEFDVLGGIAHHQGLFRGAGGGQDADDVRSGTANRP